MGKVITEFITAEENTALRDISMAVDGVTPKIMAGIKGFQLVVDEVKGLSREGAIVIPLPPDQFLEFFTRALTLPSGSKFREMMQVDGDIIFGPEERARQVIFIAADDLIGRQGVPPIQAIERAIRRIVDLRGFAAAEVLFDVVDKLKVRLITDDADVILDDPISVTPDADGNVSPSIRIKSDATLGAAILSVKQVVVAADANGAGIPELDIVYCKEYRIVIKA